MTNPNVFRVVMEREEEDGKFCTPVSQSYPEKRDALLQYTYTKNIIKEGIDMFVSEYSVDEEGMQMWVRDLTDEEMHGY